MQQLDALASYIERHAGDELLYSPTLPRPSDTAIVLRHSGSAEGLLKLRPSAPSACAALLEVIGSFTPGVPAVTPQLASFLDTHFPVAFQFAEIAARVPRAVAEGVWLRIAMHAHRIADAAPSPTQRDERLKMVSAALAARLVEVAPQSWAEQKAFRLFHGLVEFLRASRHGGDSLAPLEKVVVDPDHVLPRALCVHYDQADTQAMSQVARSLVRVYAANARCVSLIAEFIATDVAGAANPTNVLSAARWTTLLFREYVEVFGGDYLRNTLGFLVSKLQKDPERYEVDPSRLSQLYEGFTEEEMAEFLRRGQQELMHAAQLALDLIATSVHSCPPGIRLLTKHLQKCLVERFDGSDRVRYRIVASLLFERMFCMALGSSVLFPPEPESERNQALADLAKVLQQTACGTPPFETRLQFITPWIGDHIGAVDNFLNAWVEMPWPEDGMDPPPAWKGDINSDLQTLATHFRKHESELSVLTHKKIRAQEKLAALVRMLANEVGSPKPPPPPPPSIAPSAAIFPTVAGHREERKAGKL